MREVLKWSKNYRTGEEVSEKVLKPDNLIGQAKIEVRDSVTGDLVQEVETHNIIVPPAKFIPNPYYETLYQSLVHSSSTGFGVNANSPHGFTYLLLSDCKDEEDENKMAPRGNILGWCPRGNQNPGSDPKRGVYNPLESFTEFKNGYYHAHLVYDFATSQGNGDINSLWWTISCYDENLNNAAAPYRAWLVNSYNRASSLRMDSPIHFTADGKRYVSKDGNYKEIENYDKYINGIEEPKYSKEGIPDSGVMSKLHRRGFKFEGRDVYCKVNFEDISDSTNYKDNSGHKFIDSAVIKFERINKLSGEVEATYSFKIKDEFQDIYECVKKGNSARLVISHRPSSVIDEDGKLKGSLFFDNYYSNNSYPSYNTETEEITQNARKDQTFAYEIDMTNGAWILKPSCEKESLKNAQSYTNLFYIRDKINLYGRDITACIANQGDYFISDGVKYPRNTLRFNGNLNMSYYLYFINKEGYFHTNYSSSSTPSQLWKLIPSACAHSKLPETVTKTNTDTMKIQYDYYIQMPNLIPDEKGNHIPEAAPIM